MKNESTIVSYTMDEIKAMIARGEDRTDWDAVHAKTEKELEADIASDPDADIITDPNIAYKGLPPLPCIKHHISLRLDGDMLAWYKSLGKGYQTRMNAVLREFYEQHQDADTT